MEEKDPILKRMIQMMTLHLKMMSVARAGSMILIWHGRSLDVILKGLMNTCQGQVMLTGFPLNSMKQNLRLAEVMMR